MFTCEECAGNDFNVHDGLYFCSSCHTQSQDLVEETMPDDYAYSLISSGSSIGRHRIYERKGRNKEIDDPGQGWATFEAFNLVLKKQVDVLVSLGISPEFKTGVYVLWQAYLRMLGFFTAGNGFVSKLQFCPRKRDYDIIFQKRKVVSAVKKYQSQKAYRERRLKLSGFRNPKPKNVEEIEDEGLDSSSNISEYGYLSDSSESSVSSIVEAYAPPPWEQIARRHYRARRDKPPTNDASKMKLSHTISFLYVAVLLCDERILLSDILRWVIEGLLPLHNGAKKVLPDEYKFQTWDNLIFRLQSKISATFVLYRCSLLVKFLGLKHVPAKDLEIIATRFIRELHLPVSLVGIVSVLIRSEAKFTKVPLLLDHESRAVAYILVSLKLLFGFNGRSEIYLSKLAKYLNLKNGGSEYFVLTDWCHKVYILNTARKQSILHSLMARKIPYNVNTAELAEHLLSLSLDQRGNFIAKRMKQYNKNTKEIIAVLAKSFMSLREEHGTVLQPRKLSTCFLQWFAEQSGESVIGASCQELLDRNFASASLEFITDQKSTKFSDNVNEFLASTGIDCDPGRLRPWTCYKSYPSRFTTRRSSNGEDRLCSSPHFSLVLDVFSDMLMVTQSTLLQHLSLVENVVFRASLSRFRGGKRKSRSYNGAVVNGAC